MQQMLMNMLMSRLQAQNPQQANQLKQMMSNGSNPQDILKQIMTNSNSSQVEQILNMGKQMGVPDDVLNQIQNIK